MENKTVLVIVSCFLIVAMVIGMISWNENASEPLETKTLLMTPNFGSYGELALSKEVQDKVNQSRVISNG